MMKVTFLAAFLAACCLLNCNSKPPTPVITGPDSGWERAPVLFRVLDRAGNPCRFITYWHWGDGCTGGYYYSGYGIHAYKDTGTFSATCQTETNGYPTNVYHSEPSLPCTVRILPDTLVYPDSVVDTIPMGSRTDDWACILSDGSRLYVTNAAVDSLSVIDAATNSVTSTIAVPDSPTCCVASSSGQYVYVSCLAAESIAVIDVAGDSVIRTIPIDGRPGRLAILPSDSFLYVAHAGDNVVSVVRTSNDSVIARVAVGGKPTGIAAKPGGDYVCVTSEAGNAVTLIRTSDNTVAFTSTISGGPTDAEFSPTGDTVYVCCPGAMSMVLLRSLDLSAIGEVSYDSLRFRNPQNAVLLPGGQCLYVTGVHGWSPDLVILRRSDNYLLRQTGIEEARVAVPSPDGSKVYVPTKQGVVVLGLRPSR